MSRLLPDHPMLRGLWKPWPMEGELHDIASSGEIPRELYGALYRNGPNPQFAPRGDYHFFSGDGMVHGFFFENGRCDYRNRWVRTPRFLLEREAREALYGGFGGPGESDPRTQGTPAGPANTNVVWHGGKLLALVEGGLPPVELDPDTLETRGLCTYDGKLAREIAPELAEMMEIEAPGGVIDIPLTAHPKIDPETGQMLGFSYGVLPPYLNYHEIDADGRLTRTFPVETPFPAMVHDFITTRDHVIFPIFPATLRPERIANGESPLGWEPELGTQIGVMPRDGAAGDILWLQTDPCFAFHPMNAHSEGRHIVAELAQYERCPVAGVGGRSEGGGGLSKTATLVRWTLDLVSGTVKQEQIDERGLEFPRLDERRTGLAYRHGYAAGVGDGEPADDLIATHAILHYDLASGACRRHELGATSLVGEPVFVPKTADAAEGCGYLLALVYRSEQDRSDLLILDAENVEHEPLATVHLPHRIPGGFHGNWRPGS